MKASAKVLREQALPVAAWRTAAVFIDCPTPQCGGGVEARWDGSFCLMADDLMSLEAGQTLTCAECRCDFRLPEGPFRALRVRP